MLLKRILIILLTTSWLFFILYPVIESEARPGGGSGYRSSGGSRSSSSRSSSDSRSGSSGYSGNYGNSGSGYVYVYTDISSPGDLVLYLLIVGGVFFAIFLYTQVFNNKNAPTRSVVSHPDRDMWILETENLNVEIHNYQYDVDPFFSKILFLDFVHNLYYQIQIRRSNATALQGLSPYVMPEELTRIIEADRYPVQVSEIVVGSIRFIELNREDAFDKITVEIDANFTENVGKNSVRRMVIERWAFQRRKGLKTRPPAATHDLDCPNCSAPLQVDTNTDSCAYCGAKVIPGQKDWMLCRKALIHQEVSKGQQFGADVAEEGTDLESIVDYRLDSSSDDFCELHHIDNFQAYLDKFLDNIAKPIFHTLYDSWNSQKYEQARAFLTDKLYRSHKHAITEYKRANVKNLAENPVITQMELVKIDIDYFYEAFTIRIFANALMYTLDKDGKLISGNKNKPRSFSEYWTFIRRKGVEQQETEYSPVRCPNCGAGIDKMGESGKCGYCSATVVHGDFGWVLAIITQDEVYYG